MLLTAAILVVVANGAQGAGSVRTLQEQSANRTVVRIKAPESPVGFYLDRFAVAVGDGPSASMRVLRLQSHEVQLPGGTEVPISDVVFGSAQRVRHSILRWVDIPRYLRGVDGSWREVDEVVVAVDHPGLRRAVEALDSDVARHEAQLLAPTVVNGISYGRALEAQADVRRANRRAPIEDTFSRSSRWIRLEIDRGGVFRLDPADLQTAIGSDVDLIDPASLRLFSARTSLVGPLVDVSDASWREGYALRERALHVEVTGSTLGPGDAIWFFTGGPHDWRDRFDSSAGMWEFDDRITADRIALWLTYDEIGASDVSTFAASPLRMPVVDATPTGTARVDSTARSRLHFEQNDIMAFGRVQDNWSWRDRIETNGVFRHSLDLAHVHAGSSGWYETTPLMDPPRQFSGITPDLVAELRWNSTLVSTLVWTLGQQNSWVAAPYRIRIDQIPVKDGLNDLTVTNKSTFNSRDSASEMIIDYFSMAYRRDLELDGPGMYWLLPPTESALSSRWEFVISDDGSALGQSIVLDTTDPWQPRWLVGSVAAGGAELRVESAASPNGARFASVFRGGAQRPVALRRHRPRLLRQEVAAEVNGGERLGYDMVIVYPAQLRDSAEDLAAFRRTSLDGVAGARVAAVDLQDIYDQFGAGTKEPAALRNYFKFLFETDSRLRYVVLFGDGNRDARGIMENSDEDLCPAWIQVQWPRSPVNNISSVPYARDDLYVSFDEPFPESNQVNIDAPDVAIGRIPAPNLSDARKMVERIIDYESTPATGTWRNTMLLAADDEVGLAGPAYREVAHINEAELVRRRYLPPALDIDQLYLTEFPTVPGSRGKPTARQQMRSRWSEGRLIVHYIGHGSPEQLADENLFRIEDVSSLTNARKRALFVAFSCDVSIFDDPIKRSMSEQLVLGADGGAIATIAATQVTYIGPNNVMTDAFYQALYQSPLLDRSTPIGLAIWMAKVNTFGGSTPGTTRGSPFVRHNSAKYVVLGDPSLRLQSPREAITLTGELSQAIVSGQLAGLQVTANPGTQAVAGNWYLRAEESTRSVVYVMDIESPRIAPGLLRYELMGTPFFRGQGQFSGGLLQTQLRTPAFLKFGSRGRVRVIFEDGVQQFVGVADTLEVSRGVPDTNDNRGPSIDLQFANNARKVTPGMTLTATLQDSSGINVLGTVPANSILLEFDTSGVQTDVTDLFRLDENDFRRGSISIPLPNTVEPGEHKLVMSASDMMSNVSTAEIIFDVIAEGIMDIGRHTPFPNPFQKETQFAVEVIAPAGVPTSLELSVFTVDGKRIRTLRDRIVAGGGRVSIPWDGLDERGGEIANGTYLYTLRVNFEGPRGSSQTVTGRVVRMR